VVGRSNGAGWPWGDPIWRSRDFHSLLQTQKTNALLVPQTENITEHYHFGDKLIISKVRNIIGGWSQEFNQETQLYIAA
jgi:hypothetical protein